MKEIYVAATTTGGLEDQVSPVFGRAPTFTVVEVEDGKILGASVIDNPLSECGGWGGNPRGPVHRGETPPRGFRRKLRSQRLRNPRWNRDRHGPSPRKNGSPGCGGLFSGQIGSVYPAPNGLWARNGPKMGRIPRSRPGLPWVRTGGHRFPAGTTFPLGKGAFGGET
jgi:hypothetical protein